MASLSQGRTAAAQCGLFTYKSVSVIFEPPCMSLSSNLLLNNLPRKRDELLCLVLLLSQRTILYVCSSSAIRTAYSISLEQKDIIENLSPAKIQIPYIFTSCALLFCLIFWTKLCVFQYISVEVPNIKFHEKSVLLDKNWSMRSERQTEGRRSGYDATIKHFQRLREHA